MTLWQVYRSLASQRPCYNCGGVFPYGGTDVGGLIEPTLDNTGQFVITGAYRYSPRISLNGGTNWSIVDPRPGYAGYEKFDCSLDGSHLIACENPGRLQVSWDQGVTWPYGRQSADSHWDRVAMSADGVVCLAYEQLNNMDNTGRFYISTDGGVTWRMASVGTISPNLDYNPHTWNCVACSATGSKVAVVRDALDFTADLYISDNFGVDFSWAKAYPDGNNTHHYSWTDIDMSSGGSIIVTCLGSALYSYADAGHIYISEDGGNTWAESFPLADSLGHSWNNVCCSEDGTVMLARKRDSQYYDSIWYSWDTGATWKEVKPAGVGNISWGKPKVSGSGTIMSVVFTNTPWDMYVCQLAKL